MQLSFTTSAQLAGFAFKPRHVGLDVYDRQAQLAYVCVTAATGLAALAELTGEAAPIASSRYYGFSPSTLTWTVSATWTAALAIPAAWTDSESTGISRSSSDFTFASAGTYLWASVINIANSTSGKHYLFRLRDTGAGATALVGTTFANASSLAANVMLGPITVTAGQTLQLQYVTTVAGSSGNWATATLDGETARTATITCIRVA